MEGERGKEAALHHHLSAATSGDQDFPIMHWDELSQRIAELEQQEQERRERSQKRRGVRMEEMEGEFWRYILEDEDDGEVRRNRISSRFQNHRNLQLCFVNNGDSDEDKDQDGGNNKVAAGTGRNALKQEVAAALRTLRDEVLKEQKETEHVSSSSSVSSRKHLERLELEQSSVQRLSSLRKTLQHDVHALSSELVTHLLVRDQLRTTQDAMLLDVQDLT